ncbi:hypothetical protein A5636_02025 [Mycobacterium asiaticum]|uniref:Uncharacterized protein n=2 Tax=Mycobacterium asiaticum TaxID=1790 RepID=A0A1A3NBW7_MYCAS|nr:hypothetical protein A5636_02025 [Mycobacterium asiaticum]
MALTFALLVRPAKVQMPAWALVEPTPTPQEPSPPVMRAPPAEAPTKKIPAAETGPPTKKAVTKAPPRKRTTKEVATGDIPVTGDPVTERISMIRDAPTERIPVAKDPATQRIPVVKKVPAKKAAARKVPAKKVPAKKGAPTKARPRPRPQGAPTKRIPRSKDPATNKIPISDDTPTLVLPPLMPYAPYGPGSMRASPDGSGPEDWPVKGRTDSRLFYTPGDPDYDDIEAQVWFQNEEFAARAFFTAWSKSTRKK